MRVAVQARQGQHLLHEGRHPCPLRGDPLKRLCPGGLVYVAARELRVALNGGQRRTQFVGGVGDELAQLRLAAGAALHAVFHRVDHRVQGTRDVRDLDGAGGGLLADAGQLRGVVGQGAVRNGRGCRAPNAAGTPLAAHPRAAGETRRDSDDEGQADLDRDKHHDHVIDAVHLHADENGLIIDDLGSHSERAQLFEVHGVRRTIGGHMRQDLQRGLIQVGHREVGDNRTGRLAVLAHVLKGALGNAGPAKSGSRGAAGDGWCSRTRHAATGLGGHSRAVVGVLASVSIVPIHFHVRRVLDVQVFTRALGKAVQLGVHVAQHPRAHHQGGGGDHDDEREGDARGQRTRQAPGEGPAAHHWGSRMMYPAPRTVRMRAGRSASIFLRR